MITTENLNITEEAAKKLSAARWGKNAPARIVTKYEVYRAEVINYLAKIAPDFKAGDSNLVYLYLWAERIARDQAREQIAIGRAAAQSARSQLKAWDWEGLK